IPIDTSEMSGSDRVRAIIHRLSFTSAISSGKIDVLKLLLDSYGDTTELMKPTDGSPPLLHKLCFYPGKNDQTKIDMIDLLIGQYGADVNNVESYGLTALDVVRGTNNDVLANHLVALGAKSREELAKERQQADKPTIG